MAFEKLVSFTKSVSSLADSPVFNSYAEGKAAFDAAPDEVRVYLNKLIDALKKVTSGDSGAKNIGATTITGLSGSDVQTILESLKKYVDDYKIVVDGAIPVAGSSSTITLNAGASQTLTITYPKNRFTTAPRLVFSLFNTDIDGAYTIANGVISNDKDTAKIQVKNRGTTIQYVIIYWMAQ